MLYSTQMTAIITRELASLLCSGKKLNQFQEKYSKVWEFCESMNLMKYNYISVNPWQSLVPEDLVTLLEKEKNCYIKTVIRRLD